VSVGLVNESFVKVWCCGCCYHVFVLFLGDQFPIVLESGFGSGNPIRQSTNFTWVAEVHFSADIVGYAVGSCF
jgi:hypothetical protein